jgi:hypothetical protein
LLSSPGVAKFAGRFRDDGTISFFIVSNKTAPGADMAGLRNYVDLTIRLPGILSECYRSRTKSIHCRRANGSSLPQVAAIV